MPVDVVGDSKSVNVHELSIQPPKDVKKNFIVEALGEEKINEMKKAVYDESADFTDRYLSAASLILLGELKKEDLPGYPETIDWDYSLMAEWQHITRDKESIDYISLGNYFIALDLFKSGENIQHYTNTQAQEENYKLLRKGVDSPPSLVKGLVLTAMAIAFPQYFKNEDQHWIEQIKNNLETKLSGAPNINRKIESAVAYRLMFPEDEVWRSVIEESKKRALTNLRALGNLQGEAEEIIFLRLLTADKVEVTDHGLIVEDNKIEDEQEKALPERRKY